MTKTSAATAAALDDARAAGIESFISSINTKGKDPKVFTVFSKPVTIEAIPTGAYTLDLALGIGGLPKGRIVELYGPESSGKTSLALNVAAQATRMGMAVGFVDAEHAISFEHVANMGVDLRAFAMHQPDCGEEGLEMVENMVRSRVFGLVICDSVAALVPQKEIDGDMGDSHVGLHARLMSQAMRKLAQASASTGTTIIFINQIREKIGVMFGNPETTTGGRALKFYSSVRLSVTSPPGDRIKVGSNDAERQLGQHCNVRVVKNKVAPPFRKAKYALYFASGIDTAATMFDAAVETGVWVRKGNTGVYNDALTGEQVGNGKDNIIQALKDNPGEAALLEEKLRVAIADAQFKMPGREEYEDLRTAVAAQKVELPPFAAEADAAPPS